MTDNPYERILNKATTTINGVNHVNNAILIDATIDECLQAIQYKLPRGTRDDYYRGMYDAIDIIIKNFNKEKL